MKNFLLLFIFFAPLSVSAQEPIRCKSMTRWGQCTNEAHTTDSLCMLHKDGSSQQQAATATITPLTSTTSASVPTTSTTTPIATSTSKTSSTSRASELRTSVRTTTTTSRCTTSSRCVASTRSGSQCTRNAKPGSSYCWQHSR